MIHQRGQLRLRTCTEGQPCLCLCRWLAKMGLMKELVVDRAPKMRPQIEVCMRVHQCGVHRTTALLHCRSRGWRVWQSSCLHKSLV